MLDRIKLRIFFTPSLPPPRLDGRTVTRKKKSLLSRNFAEAPFSPSPLFPFPFTPTINSRVQQTKVVKPSTCTDTRVENSSPFLRNYSIDTRRWFEFWSRVIDNNFLLEIRGIKRICRTFDIRDCVSGLIWGVIFLLIRVNVRVEISYSGWRKKRECKKTRGKLFLFCIRWKFFIRSTYESVYESMYFENFSTVFFLNSIPVIGNLFWNLIWKERCWNCLRDVFNFFKFDPNSTFVFRGIIRLSIMWIYLMISKKNYRIFMEKIIVISLNYRNHSLLIRIKIFARRIEINKTCVIYHRSNNNTRA